MGATGDVLVRVLNTAGREIDLRDLAKGIVDTTTTNAAAAAVGQENGSNKKHCRRRPLRIGLDVSTWISAAAHSHGKMLIHESHITNYAKAMRVAQQQQQQQEQEGKMGNDNNAFISAPLHVQRKYVMTCTKSVLGRIRKVQQITKSELLIILDGKTPPIKYKECQQRRKKRFSAQQERDADDGALDHRIQAAKRAGAGSCYSDIIVGLIHALREEKHVQFLVSPYEADAQLAYLSSKKWLDGVITDDSDLLAYGVDNLLFRVGNSSNNNHQNHVQDNNDDLLLGGESSSLRGVLVRRQDWGAAELGRANKLLSLVDFTPPLMAVLFVIMGCDYCASLKGIGCVTARDIVRDVFLAPTRTERKSPGNFKNDDDDDDDDDSSRNDEDEQPLLKRVLDKILSTRQGQGMNKRQRLEYQQNFLNALFMYRHPIVFCPQQRKQMRVGTTGDGFLCPDQEFITFEPYAKICRDFNHQQEKIIGRLPSVSSQEMQIFMAEGWIDARTRRPISLPKQNNNDNNNNCQSIPLAVLQAFERQECENNVLIIEAESPSNAARARENRGQQQAGEDSGPSSSQESREVEC